ncbi:MAG: DUF433 domain-containing protein [Blastocatellia bacterium]
MQVEVTEFGKYIVSDPDICHGKPTFRGTRIMVWQVLEMLADGMSWDEICRAWSGKINNEAITEAIRAASAALTPRQYASDLEIELEAELAA